jgi:hypothetical protein
MWPDGSEDLVALHMEYNDFLGLTLKLFLGIISRQYGGHATLCHLGQIIRHLPLVGPVGKTCLISCYNLLLSIDNLSYIEPPISGR